MRCLRLSTALLLATTIATVLPLQEANLCSDNRARIYDRYYKKTELSRSKDGLYPQAVYIFNGKPGMVRSNGLCHDLTTKKETNEVRSPPLTTIQDTIGNRMYTNNKGQVMVHVGLHHREYRVSENINNARFAISRDRRNMFAYDSRNGSVVYMYNIQKPNVCPKDTISLIKIFDLGPAVFSLAVDNNTGNIITATKNLTVPGEWSVQVYAKLDSNPCQGAVFSDQKFRDTTQATMETIMGKYRIDTSTSNAMCNKAGKNKVTKAKCDNMEAFQTMLHAKLSEINALHATLMTDVREYYKNGDNINSNDPSLNRCESKDCEAMKESSQPEPEAISNNLAAVNRDLQTLIDGANLIGPFFNSSVFEGSMLANEIEEFSRRNYVCVNKMRVKAWQESATGAEEQFQYLVNGLNIVKGTLLPNVEETESVDAVDGIDNTEKLENSDDILSEIDVRFSIE